MNFGAAVAVFVLPISFFACIVALLALRFRREDDDLQNILTVKQKCWIIVLVLFEI